jgi:hypothetical protein
LALPLWGRDEQHGFCTDVNLSHHLTQVFHSVPIEVPTMVCPCCFNQLESNPAVLCRLAPAKEGDRYCFDADGFFAREMVWPEARWR